MAGHSARMATFCHACTSSLYVANCFKLNHLQTLIYYRFFNQLLKTLLLLTYDLLTYVTCDHYKRKRARERERERSRGRERERREGGREIYLHVKHICLTHRYFSKFYGTTKSRNVFLCVYGHVFCVCNEDIENRCSNHYICLPLWTGILSKRCSHMAQLLLSQQSRRVAIISFSI